MSSRLTRPRRTKMYDCNYNMSERYYKPMVDHLDRKYSTAPSLDRELSEIPRHYSPLADGRRREKSPSLDARRRPMSMLDEFEDDMSNNRSQSRSRAAIAEESRVVDDEVAASMKRIQASRAARAALEDEMEQMSSTRSQRKQLSSVSDYSDKLLDSVGLKTGMDIEKTRISLEDEPFFKRRTLKLTSGDDDEESGLTKWTSLKNRRQNEDLVESDLGPSAMMRARQSRNRLADLDAEMEQVADRTAARERRNNHLRALVQENHDSSEASNMTSSVRVKKTTIKSEKKTVTF